jgi:protein-tyrosine-phosphatase
MAEGFAHHLGAGVIEASSAGLLPALVIQPETFQVMAERGIQLDQKHRPRSIYVVDGAFVDLVVNMASVPASRLLKGFAGREILWPIADPIGRTVEMYRAVRDQIEFKVVDLLEELRRG